MQSAISLVHVLVIELGLPADSFSLGGARVVQHLCANVHAATIYCDVMNYVIVTS